MHYAAPVEVDVATDDDAAVDEEQDLVEGHEVVEGDALELRLGVEAGLGQHHREVFYFLLGQWHDIGAVDQEQKLVVHFEHQELN